MPLLLERPRQFRSPLGPKISPPFFSIARLRSRLSSALERVPSESPRRRFAPGSERVHLLQEVSKLTSV